MIEKLKIIAELFFVPLLIGFAGMAGVFVLLFILANIFVNG